jgi:hypothetical protein
MAETAEARATPGASEARIRALLLAYFPMFIATLSLVTSIYNGYLNGKFVDLIQRNVGRVEYMRTCKEIIDAYFQAKVRINALNASVERAGGAEHTEAANAVAKFAALGTYLANLRDDTVRARYTQLSVDLEKIVADARGLSAPDVQRRLEGTDRLFGEMNDDCVKSAKEMPL